MNRRKIPIFATAGLLFVALVVIALRPSPVPVSVVEVVQDHFVEFVEDEGRTRLREPYTVSAPISGYLHRVEREPGDRVAAGEVLFRLEAHPAPALDARSLRQAVDAVAAARARVQGAEAQLQTQEAHLMLAENDFGRQQRLLERGSVAKDQVDRARSQRDATRAAVRAARHALEVARFELQQAQTVVEIADGDRSPGEQRMLQVRSPVTGLVMRRHEWSEGTVAAGQPVLEVGDPASLEAQVDLLSMDAVRVREGMEVEIERWGGERTLAGRVRRVEPAGFTRISALGVEEQRVPVLVTLEPSGREQLGEGYRIEARFILWEGDDVLQIPTSALFRQDGEWSVYVVADGRANVRGVALARRSGLWTQITDGLTPGEQVITHPGDRVAQGTRVAPELRSYR